MMDGSVEVALRMMALEDEKEQLRIWKHRSQMTPTRAPRRARAAIQEYFESKAIQTQAETLMFNRHVSAIFVGEPYSPSVMPASSLIPIMLDELHFERIHRGRVLIVKTFCQPIRYLGIQNAIEDVLGNVDYLSIHNLPSATPADRVLPESAVVAVKEPYYEITAKGGMVRVDHPSDFVLLDPHDPLVPLQWKTGTKAGTSASQMNKQGNEAYQQHNWQEAARLYSQALAKNDNKPQLNLTLHRNRAQVYLNLGHYELAEEDALAAVIAGDSDGSNEAKILNSKAYFCAGKAQYLLGNFIQAKAYLDQAKALDPTDEAVLVDLTQTTQRISEQQSGEFDFAAMARSATSSNRRLDHASFTSNTRIGSAGNRGLGLFATKDIKHGGLVMVEKAFSVTFGDELGKEHSLIINLYHDRVDYGAHSERLYYTIEKMRQNPKQAARVLDLFGGSTFRQRQANCIDDSVVVDAFQVQAILERNGFGCPDIRSELEVDEAWVKRSGGLWIHAAHVNHSCLPNTSRAHLGDMLILRATRDIKAGDEILMDYEPATEPLARRMRRLRYYGFQCDCALCEAEEKLQGSVLGEDGSLSREIRHFIDNVLKSQEAWVQRVSPSIVAKAKDILSRVDSTYDDCSYGALPRLAGVKISMWLLVAELASPQGGLSSGPDVAVASRPLQYLGYRINVDGVEASIDRTNGVVCQHTMLAANLARHTFQVAGMLDIAAKLQELAKEVWVSIIGDLDGYKEDLVIAL